jgi:hypothetical protein
MLLPFTDQAPLFNQIDFTTYFYGGTNAVSKTKKIPQFLCPSDFGWRGGIYVTDGNTDGGGNNYCVSGGPSLLMLGVNGGIVGGFPGTPIGVADQIGVCNVLRTTTIADVTDGTSNTVAASEIITGDGNSTVFTRGDVVHGGTVNFPNTFATKAQLATFSTSCNPANNYGITGKNWINGMPGQTLFNTLNPPNSPNLDCMECGGCAWHDARGVINARSRHIGGVHVLLLDGSTRFVSNNIDINTWQHLGAISDGNVVGEF